MNTDFTPEPELQQHAQELADQAVVLLAKNLGVPLNYSDKSIEIVERFLDLFHRDIANSASTPDQIEYYSRAFGSYIGETFRRNHGATWGTMLSSGGKNACMCLNGGFFSPWDRTHKRLTIGDSERVDVYYRWILEKGNESASPPPLPGSTARPEKKSFFARFFGR